MGSMSAENERKAREQAERIRAVLTDAGWSVVRVEPCDAGCRIALIVETQGSERVLTAADVERAAEIAKGAALKPKIVDGKPHWTVHHEPWKP